MGNSYSGSNICISTLSLRFAFMFISFTNMKRSQGEESGEWRRYKGVHHRKDADKYTVQVRGDDKKQIWVGTFATAEEAARAYDRASFDLKGFRADLNFPEEYGISYYPKFSFGPLFLMKRFNRDTSPVRGNDHLIGPNNSDESLLEKNNFGNEGVEGSNSLASVMNKEEEEPWIENPQITEDALKMAEDMVENNMFDLDV